MSLIDFWQSKYQSNVSLAWSCPSAKACCLTGQGAYLTGKLQPLWKSVLRALLATKPSRSFHASTTKVSSRKKLTKLISNHISIRYAKKWNPYLQISRANDDESSHNDPWARNGTFLIQICDSD